MSQVTLKESVYLPVIDNGGGNSRSSWGLSMFMLGHSNTMLGREVVVEGISFPYPCGAMNLASASFMQSGCDRMLIIDTDIYSKPQDVEMLLSHDVTFVAGLYPKKRPGLEFPIVPLDDFPDVLQATPGLHQVSRIARGFLSLHRSVFELMQPHVEKYVCAESGKEESLYWKTLPGGHSEDFSFCDLYRQLGGKVYIDTRIRVRHEGSCSYPIPGTY